MRKRSIHTAPYEPPVIPNSWNSEERMFAQRVLRIFDELFAAIRRLGERLDELKDNAAGGDE